MKNVLMRTALLSAFILTAPIIAFAADAASDDAIAADQGAIHKDNTALKHDHSNMSQNRAAKAADKANDNYGKQAVDSAKIGANHVAVGEKKAEKSVDKGIKQNDVEDANTQ